MPRQKRTPEETKLAHRIAANKYSRKKRLDPEYRKKDSQNTRDYYNARKDEPEFRAKIRAHGLKQYYTKIKPYPEKMQERRDRIKGYARNLAERKQQIRTQLQALLGGKCIDCGITNPRLLDFDHVDPLQKHFMISQSLNKPFQVLVEEVKKCELRCPNCHRLKTIERGGYDAYKHREYRNKYRMAFKPLV